MSKKDNIRIIYKGNFGTDKFQIYYCINDKKISSWFDINYKNDDGTYNAIIEISRWTREKMEMIKSNKYHIVKQDKKNGKLRFFDYGPIPFNYGFIPQTWEDPGKKDHLTGYPGDDDPIDVVEISNFQIKHGMITRIKILGVLYMIDEGETDWKVIVVSNLNRNFKNINSLKDVSNEKLNLIKKWFVNYKKKENASWQKENGVIVKDFLSKNDAIDIIESTHASFVHTKI